MKLGNIVEMLISIKDDYDLAYCERNAINDACNILEKFPRDMEKADAEEVARSTK